MAEADPFAMVQPITVQKLIEDLRMRPGERFSACALPAVRNPAGRPKTLVHEQVMVADSVACAQIVLATQAR